MATAAEISCEICGYRSLYDKDNPKAKPERCKRCGNVYGSGIFMSEPDSDASPTTHNMLRWGCRECHHYGVRWIPKNAKGIIHCPNCNAATGSSFRQQRFDPSGSCKTIWQPVERVTRAPIKVNLPKKRFQCNQCGYIQRYLIRPKSPCPRCGVDTGVQHAAS